MAANQGDMSMLEMAVMFYASEKRYLSVSIDISVITNNKEIMSNLIF